MTDPLDDRMGEALRRYRHGEIRPLWADWQECEQKQAWRRLGAKFREAMERSGLEITEKEKGSK